MFKPLEQIGFSGREGAIVIFLSVALIAGTVLKYARDHHWWAEPTEIVSNNHKDINYRIDINKAEWNELLLLPRIGEKKAMAIVSYRNKHGGFRTIDELCEIEGIGEATLNSIRTMITVGKESG